MIELMNEVMLSDIYPWFIVVDSAVADLQRFPLELVRSLANLLSLCENLKEVTQH